MATVTYTHGYWTYNSDTLIYQEIGPTANITFDGDTLAIGTEMTVFGYPMTFAGLSVEGGIYFQSDYGLVLVTDETYAPNAAAPALEAENLVVCFLPGTLIATPLGPTPIERLAIGDLVTRSDGDLRAVRWIGRQSVRTMFQSEVRLPVRIAAGALGEDLPIRDLRVTADHALLVDGALVQAGALVNGTTITRMTAADLGEDFTVYHVELDDHSLVLAEGVPAETFVDNVGRRRFDNWAEYEALYGDTGSTIAELELPRIKSARQLPQRLRERLAERAAELRGRTATAA